MYNCGNCNNSINFIKKLGSITKCPKCGWYNRLKDEDMENVNHVTDDFFFKKIRKKKTKFPNIKIKRYGSKLLFCYNFNLRALYKYMEISKKTGLALEKFLNCGKESLSNEEKNILYKLKAYPFKKVEERVRYLKAKKDCIELLHYLDF